MKYTVVLKSTYLLKNYIMPFKKTSFLCFRIPVCLLDALGVTGSCGKRSVLYRTLEVIYLSNPITELSGSKSPGEGWLGARHSLLFQAHGPLWIGGTRENYSCCITQQKDRLRIHRGRQNQELSHRSKPTARRNFILGLVKPKIYSTFLHSYYGIHCALSSDFVTHLYSKLFSRFLS